MISVLSHFECCLAIFQFGFEDSVEKEIIDISYIVLIKFDYLPPGVDGSLFPTTVTFGVGNPIN